MRLVLDNNTETGKISDEFKEKFLLALNDKDIRKALRKISDDDISVKRSDENSEKQVKELCKTIKKLTEEKQKLKEEKEELEQENKTLKSEVKTLNSSKIKLEDELENQKDAMRPYLKAEMVYRNFCTLNKDIRSALANTINDSDAVSFIISGCALEKFDSLWQYIKFSMDRLTEEENRILQQTFRFFFESYNNCSGEYSLLDTKQGQAFDTEFHSKGSNSLSAGDISEVLLQGYKDINSGRIIEKSIVRV